MKSLQQYIVESRTENGAILISTKADDEVRKEIEHHLYLWYGVGLWNGYEVILYPSVRPAKSEFNRVKKELNVDNASDESFTYKGVLVKFERFQAGYSHWEIMTTIDKPSCDMMIFGQKDGHGNLVYNFDKGKVLKHNRDSGFHTYTR